MLLSESIGCCKSEHELLGHLFVNKCGEKPRTLISHSNTVNIFRKGQGYELNNYQDVWGTITWMSCVSNKCVEEWHHILPLYIPDKEVCI